MEGRSKIPFIKPVRVGNFKLWRSKYQMSAYPELEEDERKRIIAEKGKVRKEKVDVECINISNLEGTWKVQIPSTFEMFAVIDYVYADFIGDKAQHDEAQAVFSCIFANMMYVSAIGNGYYHRALEMVATCYADPTVLKKKGGKLKELKKETSKLIEDFLEWRMAYDDSRVEPTEEDGIHEDLAEKVQKYVVEDALEDDTRGNDNEV